MQGAMSLSDSVFESRSDPVLPERILQGAAGLFCFLPLWDFFIRPGGNPFQLGLLPFWIIALGAMSIGLPLLAGAVLGGKSAIRLDGESRQVSVTTRSPFSHRTRQWRFDAIRSVDVVENSWSDGPASHDLLLQLEDVKKPLCLRSFARAEDADEARAAILRIIGPSPS